MPPADATKPRLLILYGSQTGNAQDAAERLGREASARHFAVAVCSTASFPPSALPDEPRVVFVVSTTGQGDPPDSFRSLWKLLLRKALASDALRRTAVAVFGLGDSGYPKYNVTAKKLDRRLEALGARRLAPLGLGDDQHALGYEAALEAWASALWATLRAECPLPPGAPPDPAPGAPLPPPALRLRVDVLPDGQLPPPGERDSDAEVAACVAAAAQLDALLAPPVADDDTAPRYNAARPCLAHVARNVRLTAEAHSQEVRHLELDLGADGPAYAPGDALAIAPLTPRADADALLARLGLPSAAMLRVSRLAEDGSEERASFEVAARHVVRGCLDVTAAPPRRTLFELLARFAAAPHEAARLAHFGSAEGREELSRYVTRERRCLAEVLGDFPSCQPPLEALLQAAPRARPRLYSISGAPDGRSAHITAAVVRWATPLKRPRQGLLTPQLAAARIGDCFAVWAERGALRLPAEAATPLLMIGPGTGVAPFRAFVQARAAAPGGPAALFFGCRASAGDFLYADEWAAHAAEGGPLAAGPGGGFFASFSRDGAAKAYVTHALRREGARVWRLLQAGAAVYVAGSGGAMPRDVFDAFTDVVAQHGGMALPDAAAFLRRLEAQRRYCVEVWS